jgi:phosphoribosylformylglycinamidine synthase
MAPWEIWISESQERMLLAVPPENLEEVVDIFHSEQVEVKVLGSYVEGEYANLTYRGDLVGKIHLKSLFNPPKIKRTISWQPKNGDEPFFKHPQNLGGVLNKLLTSYNIASKERVVRRYDQEVKGQTVVKPLQGWFAGPNDAAVLKPLKNSWKGISISSGINSGYGKINPYWMAASAIDEAIRNNIAVGGRRIALLDNFTWGNPEYTDRMGGLIYASRACYDVAKVYGTPFISGKDSLYNESPLGPITPTLLITGLGIVPDVRKAVTMELKESGNNLYLLGETKPELGGSEYYRLNRALGSSVPKLEPVKTLKSYNKLTEAIDRGLVRACHDLSEGGLAVAASEMAFTGDLGLEIDLQKVKTSSKMRLDYVLFSESNGRFLVEVKPENNNLFEEMMNGTIHSKIGFVKKEKNLTINDSKSVVLNEDLTRLITSWKTPLEART